MPIIEEYPNHKNKIKLIFVAIFSSLYFVIQDLGHWTYSWQNVADINVWANSFLTTAMFYCTFDLWGDFFLMNHKDFKPLVSIFAFVLSTLFSNARFLRINPEITPEKEGITILFFFVYYLGFLLLELYGYDRGAKRHSKALIQRQKDYLRELNILSDDELTCFIHEYSRIVSNPEVFAQLMPGAPYESYVQMLGDALEEQQRRAKTTNKENDKKESNII